MVLSYKSGHNNILFFNVVLCKKSSELKFNYNTHIKYDILFNFNYFEATLNLQD